MVGQQNMRLALILNVIDPAIGGVLICGHRGTGKSTAVRALTTLFPALTGVADCPYFCDHARPQRMCTSCLNRHTQGEILPVVQRQVPLVTLPLNASEDRVAGSFDLTTALTGKTRTLAPGLLATANRGILYVDEINLLNDHISDLLLDARGLGIHRVERDGISMVHPAHIVLIGTMNPEEGLLRPQLLDRIGLYVEADDLRDPEVRATVVERRLAYDAAPADFVARWAPDEQALRQRIQQAQQLLPGVSISAYFRQVIAYLVDRQLRAEGHRGDVVVLRAARALAAWENRTQVERSDIEQAVALALPHRARAGGAVVQQLTRTFEQLPGGAFDAEQPEELGIIDEDIDQRTDEREGAAGLTRPLHGEDDVVQIQDLITIARDRVAILVFRFAQGRLVLPPTRNFTSARRCVEKLYVGGCTPLATGLLEGLRLAESERLRDPAVKPLLIVLTDGLANIDLSGNMRSDTPWRDALSIAQEIAQRRIPTVMIDTNPYNPSTIAAVYGTVAQEVETKAQPGRDLALTLAADYYQLCPPHLELLRSEEHTSELQSHSDLVCRLLLEKKKKNIHQIFKMQDQHAKTLNLHKT